MKLTLTAFIESNLGNDLRNAVNIELEGDLRDILKCVKALDNTFGKENLR